MYRSILYSPYFYTFKVLFVKLNTKLHAINARKIVYVMIWIVLVVDFHKYIFISLLYLWYKVFGIDFNI